ncbi:MAG: TfoX/Sxy family protein [Cyanobium sp. MAG06]|nr:TfoX/Sxy family protein [Cyanobium sp. MAG06]
MATSISTIEYILDQLSDIENIDYKKMFGNYALYKNKKTISLICNNNMYLKNFQEIRDFVKSSGYNYKEGYPFPGAKV